MEKLEVFNLTESIIIKIATQEFNKCYKMLIVVEHDNVPVSTETIWVYKPKSEAKAG
jgi:hypothetical protein